ncbi:hypothetical protein [Sphingobacterium luzhongxinii]|uniref:hypothetical protein n=1 Tax=Sphingobacterium luzhongxinii TaxID=2654181 RepID=UPI0013DB1A37|nr:hypothetical protein [Sphingobacterium sp. xlx-73]
MSRKYKLHNIEGLYFVSFAIVYWLDIFVRKQYCDILVSSYNPVEAGFVDEPHYWQYSSARDYSGQKGLLDIDLV